MSPMATTRAREGRRYEARPGDAEVAGAAEPFAVAPVVARARSGATTGGVEARSGFASGVRLQASVPKAPTVRIFRRRTVADERMRASEMAAFFKERPKSRYRWHTGRC